MNRILLVDNESYIVDGLAESIREERPQLEIYKAYSAAEALDWLYRTKIDVVLSDIKMPGMSGLELQKQVVKQWPRCKMIFLSGFNDFSYVQEAMRHGGIDYLLKTDGDKKILEAIDRALEALQQEVEEGEVLQRARQMMKEALPLLRRDFLLDLLHGDRRVLRLLPSQLKELDIPLDADLPVLMFLGRVDEWPDNISAADRSLFHFAIQNVTEECLGAAVRSVSVRYDSTRLVWFTQLSKLDADGLEAWMRMQRYVYGTLESVQEACSRLFRVKVSFAVEPQPDGWALAAERVNALSRHMNKSRNSGGLMQLLELVQEDKVIRPAGDEARFGGPPAYKLELLSSYLETGQNDEFFAMLQDIVDAVGDRPDNTLQQHTVYFSIIPILLSYITNRYPRRKSENEFDLQKLIRLDQHASWSEAVRYVTEFADTLITLQTDEQEKTERETIRKIHEYIDTHLDEDLSLTRLGEIIGYNPTYLSRFYKQAAGQGLSDFIAETRLRRAKELLAKNQLKMSEISARIGFVSDHYFYRFFKRATNMTPQEYRDMESGKSIM